MKFEFQKTTRRHTYTKELFLFSEIQISLGLIMFAFAEPGNPASSLKDTFLSSWGPNNLTSV